MSNYLRIARSSSCCRVLGPGKRAVLWLQGCLQNCTGCVTPETWSLDGGEIISIDNLTNFLINLPDIEGVTFSGGEPMLQAEGIIALIDRFRYNTNLSVMLFTGYTFEHLTQQGTTAQRKLVSILDILVDGPYMQHRHTDLYWRGSDNQRVFFLSERYRDSWHNRIEQVNETPLEFEIDHDTVHWMGIPPKGFRNTLENELRSIGIDLTPLPNN